MLTQWDCPNCRFSAGGPSERASLYANCPRCGTATTTRPYTGDVHENPRRIDSGGIHGLDVHADAVLRITGPAPQQAAADGEEAEEEATQVGRFAPLVGEAEICEHCGGRYMRIHSEHGIMCGHCGKSPKNMITFRRDRPNAFTMLAGGSFGARQGIPNNSTVPLVGLCLMLLATIVLCVCIYNGNWFWVGAGGLLGIGIGLAMLMFGGRDYTDSCVYDEPDDEDDGIFVDAVAQDPNIPTDVAEKCTDCGGNLETAYGLAGGGMGTYQYCEDCGKVVSKQQDTLE